MVDQLLFDIEDDELEIFLEEVNEHLQVLESGILGLEQATDADTINSVFRAAHTIKALAGTVGHHRMADLTHTMETIFDAMREGNLSPSETVADDLLATVDVLKLLRDEIVNRTPSNVDVDDFLVRLRVILEDNQQAGRGKNGNGAVPVRGVSVLTAKETDQAKEFQRQGFTFVEVVATTDPASFAPAARLSQVALAVMDAAEIIHQEPSMDDLLNGKHKNHIKIIAATKENKDTIQKLVADVVDLTSYQIEPYHFESPKQKSKRTAKQLGTNVDLGADKTVRISIDRLDSLMNLVGELVTDRNRLLQIEGTLLTNYGKEGSVTDLSEMNAHVGRVVDQLQEEVMRARMLPIGSTFNKMPRLVRDVSRAAGKQVNLVIEGEDTELDRSLIEFIGDPLIHLLRNAVDHGLETPQERVAVGKSPTGTVLLTATHQEGHIVVTVKDDGRGIDPDRVRRAAVKRGILSEEETAQLDDDEAVDLIFRPNLSTAEKVTEVSGRGVGMDVVRANIERLSGSVVVESKVGQGTTFKITLPLTLAIVQTMLVSMNGITFAIPLSTIIESLYLSDVTVSTVKGSQVIHWRDSVLSLVDLREYFSHPRLQTVQAADNDKAAIVTVAWGKQRLGLVVDRIIGKQDIVVKSLSPIMGELPGISGGTILGDGSIALIIDIPGLIATALQARRQGTAV